MAGHKRVNQVGMSRVGLCAILSVVGSALSSSFAPAMADEVPVAIPASVIPSSQPPTPASAAAPISVGAVSAAVQAPTLDALIRGMDAPEFRVREAATQRVLGDDSFTLDILEAKLKSLGNTLSLEGRTRLVSIARDRFMRTPRAAMGVSFGGAGLVDRIVVGDTHAPFESKKLLEPGDLIVEADGKPLHGPGVMLLMQSIIVSHEPEQVIPLIVRRGAEKLAINVRLGSFKDLPGAALNDGRLGRAWRYRSASYSGSRPEVAKFDVSVDEWANERLDQRALLQTARRINAAAQVGGGGGGAGGGDNDAPVLAGAVGGGGGNTRNANGAGDEPQVMRQVIMINGRRRIIPVAVGRFDANIEQAEAPMTVREELVALDRTRSQIRSQLKDVGNRAVQIQQREYVDLLTKQLAIVDKQQKAIEAELIERGESIPDVTTEGPREGPREAKPPAGVAPNVGDR